MTDSPARADEATGSSLSIQSIVYGNPVDDIVRAVRATINSAVLAGSVLGQWEIAIGDCSPSPLFDKKTLALLAKESAAAGGAFRYEFFDANLGHGGGHNRLERAGDSDLLFFLNPDALVGPDTLRELVTAMQDATIGAGDGRQLPLDHPKYYDPKTGDASWASGACLITRRAVYRDAGGFDHESFFLYGDDVDYSWRVRLAGLRVIHVPAARVFHDKRLDVSGRLPPSAAELYYSAESALMLAHKYSREKIVETISGVFRRGEAGEPGTAALAEYEARLAKGELPVPLDPHHRVGQFIEGNYARHRS